MSDGVDCLCRTLYEIDAVTTIDCETWEDPLSLLYLGTTDDLSALVHVGHPTFVSGGLDATVSASSLQPRVCFLFFYGDDWQAAMVKAAGISGGTAVLNTGFTGSNLDNQILFNLPGVAASVATARRISGEDQLSFGVATRRGIAGTIQGQHGNSVAPRDAVTTSTNASLYRLAAQAVCRYAGIRNVLEISDWQDGSVTFSHVEGGSPGRKSINALIIDTGTRRPHVANHALPTADGNWIIGGAPFQPEFALMWPMSNQATGFVSADCYNGGLAVATSAAEYSSIFSSLDAATDAVCKTLENNKFMDILQPAGIRGWDAPAGAFSFTTDGFRVDNVTVATGHPASARLVNVLLLEGVGGPVPVNLDIATLRHAHPVDAPIVQSSYDLIIDNLDHAHRLDAVDVQLSDAINLIIQGLRHGHPVDTVAMTSEWTLIPGSLRHAHPVDQSAVYWRIEILAQSLRHGHRMDTVDVQAAPEIIIEADDMRHGHPVDALLIVYETTLAVDELRHGHPVDAPDVSSLMGLLTALRQTGVAWEIDAGAVLANSSGVDAGWHVLDLVFDGANSILGVDGVRVTGNAGVRDLTLLTIGSENDGSNRLIGDIAELRIYNGVLTSTQRDEILTELQGKWL